MSIDRYLYSILSKLKELHDREIQALEKKTNDVESETEATDVKPKIE